MSGNVRAVLLCLWALAPLTVASVWLRAYAPTPVLALPHDDAPRELVVHSEVRGFPGRAAIAPAGAATQWQSLPFERVLTNDAATADELVAAGYTAHAGPPGLTTYERERSWSLTDEWPQWQLRVRHGDTPTACDERFRHGGFGCGAGVRFIPEALRYRGSLVGVVHVTKVPQGSQACIETQHAPASVRGEVFAFTKPVTVAVTRGPSTVERSCGARCSLPIDTSIDAPIQLCVDGPARAFALSLLEAS